MKFKDAAYQILINEKRPLTAKEIYDFAVSEGLITTEGKTPSATIGAVIYTDIKKMGDISLFKKEKRGVFGLRVWNKTTDINIDETVEISPKKI